MADSVPQQRNQTNPLDVSETVKPQGSAGGSLPRVVRSLLELMAAEPGSGLVEIQPGMFVISKDFTAEELDRD